VSNADAEIVHWRTAEPDEVPGGAKTVANAAHKAGFAVRLYFSRGPWVNAKEPGEDEETGICEMIAVTGRLHERRFRASWHRKLWTKDGAEGKYKFAGAQIWPPRRGEPVATKAKKDRHPEHLGAETVGGLKNSKTLNDYLKEDTTK
jgi:hypothetical protein